MAFGELNIPSSRAFWDDCDEDEPVQKDTETKRYANTCYAHRKISY